MRKIFEHEVGGDGGMVGLDVDGGYLELRLKYPVVKIVEPVKGFLSPLKDKMKALVPIQVVKDAIDKGWDLGWEEAAKLLGESAPA